MAVTVISDFTGTNGAAINPAQFKTLLQGASTASIQNNKARSVMAGGYNKVSFESVPTFGVGEVRAEFTRVDYVNVISFGFCSSSPYDAPYSSEPINGYTVYMVPDTNTLELRKTIAEGSTVLGSTSLSVAAIGASTTIAVARLAGSIEVRVWPTAGTRPVSPSLTSSDTTYLSGELRPSAQSGDNPSTLDWDNIVFDDTPPANAAPTADAGPDQTVDSGDLVTLTGSGTDTDGTIASYAWTLPTRPVGSAATLSGSGTTRTFTADVAGVYVASLVVTDDDGAASPADTVTVTAGVENGAAILRWNGSTWERRKLLIRNAENTAWEWVTP